MAMKYVDIVQGTDEWHQWRSQFVTASIVPAIMGASPHETPYAAVQYLRGLRKKKVSEWFTRRGNALEDPARRTIQDRFGKILLPVCGESTRTNYLAASFDGIDDDGLPHEIKAPSNKVWNEVLRFGRDSAPYRMYRWQVLAQMYVCESDVGYLHFYSNGNLETFRIERMASAELLMLDAIEATYQHKLNGTLPVPDKRVDTYVPEGAEANWFKPLAVAYKRNKVTAKKAQTLYESEKQVLDSIGDSLDEFGANFMAVEHADLRISRHIREGGYDQEKLVDKLAERLQRPIQEVEQKLAACRGSGSSQVRVSVMGSTRSDPQTKASKDTEVNTVLQDGCFTPQDDEASRFEELADSYRDQYRKTKEAEAKMKKAKEPLQKIQEQLNEFGSGFAAVEGFGVRVSRFDKPGSLNVGELAILLESEYGMPVQDTVDILEESRHPRSRQKRITDKRLSKSRKQAA